MGDGASMISNTGGGVAANPATSGVGGAHRHGHAHGRAGDGADFANALATAQTGATSTATGGRTATGPIASALGDEFTAMLTQLQNGAGSAAANATDHANGPTPEAGSPTAAPTGSLLQRFADTARSVGGLALSAAGPAGLAAGALL